MASPAGVDPGEGQAIASRGHGHVGQRTRDGGPPRRPKLLGLVRGQHRQHPSTGRLGRGDAGRGILDDEAAGCGHAQQFGCTQIRVRRWLAARHVLCGDQHGRLGQPGGGEPAPRHHTGCARGDAPATVDAASQQVGRAGQGPDPAVIIVAGQAVVVAARLGHGIEMGRHQADRIRRPGGRSAGPRCARDRRRGAPPSGLPVAVVDAAGVDEHAVHVADQGVDVELRHAGCSPVTHARI